MIKLEQEIVNAMLTISNYNCGNTNCTNCPFSYIAQDGDRECMSVRMEHLITRYKYTMKKQAQDKKEVNE